MRVPSGARMRELGHEAEQRLKRSESLERAGEEEQSSATADQQAAEPSTTCPNAGQPQPANEATPAPTYYQLGLSFDLTQYGIGKRKLGVKISDFSNGEVTSATGLQRADLADSLPRGEPGTRDPLKLQPPAGTDGAPEPFLGEITEKKNRLKVGPAIKGYELVDGGADKLNGLIGRTLAIHVQRSGILKPNGSGNFRGTMLGKPESGLNATEVLGIKLYVFLRAQLGKEAAEIRELVDGKIGALVAQADYDKRKLILKDANKGHALGGDMPLIPGVYQIYVLLEDRSTGQPGSGGFELAEVHCDGDCLYARA